MLSAKFTTRVTIPSVRSERTKLTVRCVATSTTSERITTNNPRRPSPLIERLGGAAGVRIAVDIFYGKVLADDRVNHYFVNTNMQKQRAHQAAFMTYAFGGADKYKGKDMVEAHRHLLPHLEDIHFNAIVEHLASTLKDLNVAQAEINDCLAIVESTREQIVRGY